MSTVDQEEIEKFSRIADEWWDDNGKFKPLHQFNPVRISFIKRKIIEHFAHESYDKISLTKQTEIFSKLEILDVGCGGGLISEPFARIGANMTGIDAAEKNIKVAQLHSEKSGLKINYQNCAAEDLVKEDKKFDVVFALEIIEHVADVEEFVKSCSSLVKPGGLLFIATMNRTLKSLAFAKFAAEYILRWLPAGTHDWKKFLKPSEIAEITSEFNLQPQETTGFSYNPLSKEWKENANDLTVNYICSFTKL